LAGSAIGGITSFASAWLTQQPSGPAKRFREKTSRQKLYEQFIDEASKLYADGMSSRTSENVLLGVKYVSMITVVAAFALRALRHLR